MTNFINTIFYFTATDAKSQNFTYAFAGPGEYTINVTAYNLHKDEVYGAVGHIANMTRMVVVQQPVKEWTINMTLTWLDTNGGKMAKV